MSLDARCDAIVRDGWQAGRKTHGELAISLGEFRRHVEYALKKRLKRLQKPSADSAARHVLQSMALSDLYLALACERRSERAWRTVRGKYGKVVYWRLRRMGATHAEAVEAADDFPGRWATPPPRGSWRTLFGTFLGVGSLRGFIATVEGNRWKHGLSNPLRRWLSLDMGVHDRGADIEHSAPPQLTARSYKIIDAAWTRLDARTRAGLILKFVHGLKQREIAEAFGLSESRVSRILNEAAAVLNEALSAWVESGILPDRKTVADALLARMKSSRAQEPYQGEPGGS